jgi:hypothetical protein
MIETITAFYEQHQLILGMVAGISVFMFVVSILSLPFLVSLIPVDYFQYAEPYKVNHTFKHPVIRLIIVSLKNLMGWLLILAGIIMLFLPGQGLVTLVAGLLLINFPGKRKLERKLVSSDRVLHSINWLRVRHGKAPLLAPE